METDQRLSPPRSPSGSRDSTPLEPRASSNSNYYVNVFQSSLNLLAHILIGITVGGIIILVFRNEFPLSATLQHIILCVLGYHLLMAQAILSLSPGSGWTSKFTLVDKRRVHWILQIVGSLLAIAGSFIKILDKTSHWETVHGRFALVALVFTSVSLVNGIATLYAVELRGRIPMNLSKLTHICFGIIAFTAACICLFYGLDKGTFRNWATDRVASIFRAFVIIYMSIIIINPLISFFRRSMQAVRK